jgi:hypothetical protein
MRSKWLLYWLYDDTCVDHTQHGYIGVTKESRLAIRMHQHQHNSRIPKPFRYAILYRESQKIALAMEAILRPRPHIGWNIGIGGFPDGKSLRGVPKTPEQREKMKAAALRRYADPAERERTQKAVKHAFEYIDRSGANNSRYGAVVSETTKQKMRDRIAERGGVTGEKNPNYRTGEFCRRTD